MDQARHRSSRSARSAAVLACGMVLLSMAYPAHAVKPKRDAKHQVEQLEEQWRTAQLAGDIVTMDKMLADDYVGITMSGQITTKAQSLNRMKSHTLVLTRLDPEERKIKFIGQVAIVTVRARVEGTSEQTRMDGEYRYTRIYQHLPSGVWKITNFEATRIPSRQQARSDPDDAQEQGEHRLRWRSDVHRILPSFRLFAQNARQG